jgi:hypothetical protein
MFVVDPNNRLVSHSSSNRINITGNSHSTSITSVSKNNIMTPLIMVTTLPSTQPPLHGIMSSRLHRHRLQLGDRIMQAEGTATMCESIRILTLTMCKNIDSNFDAFIQAASLEDSQRH